MGYRAARWVCTKRNEDDPFTRLLTHPHETEQAFTRSQSGLLIVQDDACNG